MRKLPKMWRHIYNLVKRNGKVKLIHGNIVKVHGVEIMVIDRARTLYKDGQCEVQHFSASDGGLDYPELSCFYEDLTANQCNECYGNGCWECDHKGFLGDNEKPTLYDTIQALRNHDSDEVPEPVIAFTGPRFKRKIKLKA